MVSQSKVRKSRGHYPAASRGMVLEKTTNLAAIAGRRVVVLLDEQNLSISGEKHGYELKYNLLAERINSAADMAEIHIFTAADLGNLKITKRRFENLGYQAHVKLIRRKQSHNGRQHCDSNIDNLFAFWAGLQARRTTFDMLVLGSGDYGLSGELAEELYEQRRNKAMSIMTLSLPGSTSQDLDAETNPNITANLEIGLDLLKPLAHRKCRSAAATVGSFRQFRFRNFF